MHYIKRPLKALKVIITLNSQLSTFNSQLNQLSILNSQLNQLSTFNSKLSTYYRSNNVFSSPAYASK